MSTSARAQPSCFDCDGAVLFEILDNIAVPPISIAMPPHVAEGYQYFDGICRLGFDINQVDSFFSSMTFSDTPQRTLKHLYEINDYDPVTFCQMLMSSSTRYETGPGYVRHSFSRYAAPIFPEKLFSLLEYSDIIAHVKVIDTFSTVDDSATYAKEAIGVTCQVLDTIKGYNWPAKKINRRKSSVGEEQAQVLVNSDLQFEYCPTWNRMWDIDLINDDGSPWISKDKEYIVFLRFQRLTTTDSSLVLTLWPTMTGSTMGTMYPTDSGIVQDPNDDCGFGRGLTSIQWKKALRRKIDELLSVEG